MAAKKNEGTYMKIEGALSIYEAAELRGKFLKYFKKNSKGLTLDLGDVTECDTAGAQILCSTKLSAAESGKPFIITDISPSVRDTFVRCGLPMEEILKGE